MRFLLKKGWLLLGIGTCLIKCFASAEWIESSYSRGFFLTIREGIDAVVPQVPFAPFYLFFPFAFLLLGYCFRHLNHAPLAWRRRWWRVGGSLLNFWGGLTFSFLLLWGYNYNRTPVSETLGFSDEALSLVQIKEELTYQTGIITQMRESISVKENLLDDEPVTGALTPDSLNVRMRKSLEEVLAKYDYPTDGSVNIRELQPEGILFRFNASGIYLPFTGEGHIDAALHPLQKPFVIAHEMAHGYGFADEGTCNFWAYLACIHNYDFFVRYTGHLAYWRYLASAFKRQEPEAYNQFRGSLPLAIQTDLNTINERLKSYPSIFGGNDNFVYDYFLQAQGIEEGLANYDQMVPLVRSYWVKMRPCLSQP